MQTDFELMGGTYRQAGDFLLPNLETPESPKIGIWGERYRKHLQEHKEPLYTAMQLSGTLDEHLERVDREATEMFDRLVHQLAACEDITDELKATNQLAWVGQMNNIRHRAAEIVRQEVFYA